MKSEIEGVKISPIKHRSVSSLKRRHDTRRCRFVIVVVVVVVVVVVQHVRGGVQVAPTGNSGQGEAGHINFFIHKFIETAKHHFLSLSHIKLPRLMLAVKLTFMGFESNKILFLT